MCPLGSKIPTSTSGLPRSSAARNAETRARENTRRRPSRAILEQSGTKSKHEGKKSKASGVPPKVEDKIGFFTLRSQWSRRLRRIIDIVVFLRIFVALADLFDDPEAYRPCPTRVVNIIDVVVSKADTI